MIPQSQLSMITVSDIPKRTRLCALLLLTQHNSHGSLVYISVHGGIVHIWHVFRHDGNWRAMENQVQFFLFYFFCFYFLPICARSYQTELRSRAGPLSPVTLCWSADESQPRSWFSIDPVELLWVSLLFDVASPMLYTTILLLYLLQKIAAGDLFFFIFDSIYFFWFADFPQCSLIRAWKVSSLLFSLLLIYVLCV